MPKILEVYEHLGSYHQRVIYEVHPELSFYQLNNDRPLTHPKRTDLGRRERERLLTARMPGVDRLLRASVPVQHERVVDAAASLWTARRIFARAVMRLPEHPEWDEQGFRMEMVR